MGWLVYMTQQNHAAHNYCNIIMTVLPHIDQCPIPWENVSSNVTFAYSVNESSHYLAELSPQGEIVSVCTSNGIWYPNTQSNTDSEGLSSIQSIS